MEIYGGEIDENTEAVIIYRQNELYDSIREGVESEMGENASSIVIPAGTENLDPQEEEKAVQYLVEADENDIYVVMDQTSRSILSESASLEGNFESVGDAYNRSMDRIVDDSFRDRSSLEEFNNSLNGLVAEIGKTENLNSLVLLLSNRGGQNTLADHEIYIEEGGQPVEYVNARSDHRDPFEGDRRVLKGNPSSYEEVFNYIRDVFEEEGYEVYPAVSEEGTAYIAKDFDNIEFDSFGNPDYVDEEADISPESSIVLTDRHIRQNLGFARRFTLEDGPIIKDGKHGDIVSVSDKDNAGVEDVVEKIKNQDEGVSLL